jgi:GT2 family glycosyltransferase
VSSWKVLHVQVSDIGPIALDADEAGLYVCFWHGEVPLGHRELLASQLPLSASQARELAAAAIAPALRVRVPGPHAGDSTPAPPLQQLRDTWRPGNVAWSRDTALVICTRNRPEQLERCLRSLCALDPRPAEILVVDNSAGDPATAHVVAAFHGVRYVVEPTPGLSRARNAGVHATSNPVIAFTDDDMVVTPTWLRELTAPFADAGVAATCGLVLPAELRTDAQLVFEREFGGLNRGYLPRVDRADFLRSAGPRAAPVWDICVGGNMAIRRSAFERSGMFDERLGAGAAGCSEDSELWYRILASGGACAYVPTAVVHHYHRVDMDLLGSQIYFYMRGHVAALLVQFAASRDWRNLHRVLVQLPVHSAETLLRQVLCGDSRPKVLLTGTRGCVAGVWYWLRHPRRREPEKRQPRQAAGTQ